MIAGLGGTDIIDVGYRGRKRGIVAAIGLSCEALGRSGMIAGLGGTDIIDVGYRGRKRGIVAATGLSCEALGRSGMVAVPAEGPTSSMSVTGGGNGDL